MKLWIARDEDGKMYLHPTKPYKVNTAVGAYWDNGEGNWLWLQKNQVPEVTFENSPMEVELKLIEK